MLVDEERFAIARIKTAHTLCVVFCVTFSIALMSVTPCSLVGRPVGEGIDKSNACGLGATLGTFFPVMCWGWISALAELAASREFTPRHAAEGVAKGLGGAMSCVALFTFVQTG